MFSVFIESQKDALPISQYEPLLHLRIFEILSLFCSNMYLLLLPPVEFQPMTYRILHSLVKSWITTQHNFL